MAGTNIGTLVLLKLEGKHRYGVTLTGTAGTANIAAVGGLTKLVTYGDSLTDTAADFVTSHKAAYAAVNIRCTSSGVVIYFESYFLSTALTLPTITNASGNLAGTVAEVVANNANVVAIGETSTSFSSAQTIIDISNKLSGNDSEFKAGRITRTISLSSLASTDPNATGFSFEAAASAQEEAVPITWVISQYDSLGVLVPGTVNLSGSAFISNVTWDVPDNDKMTYSCDLQVTGEVSITTNA